LPIHDLPIGFPINNIISLSASYGLDTEVWISQDSTISNASILALEELLQTKSEKDVPDMSSDGVESIY